MVALRGAPAVVAFLADVTAQPIKASSENEARALLCQAFRSEWLDVASLLKLPQTPPARASSSCAIGDVTFPGTEDGRWHLLGFPGDVFVNMYEPPERDFVHPPTSWSLQRQGPFAIHQVLQPAYVCPTNATDLCVAWHPGGDHDESNAESLPKAFYCTDEQALPCDQHGYNSEIYLLDPATDRTFAFGPFEQEDIPTVAIRSSSRVLAISTPNCHTELSF